jgi:exportin-1
MRGIISELEAHQVYVFYEAVGFMISAEKKEEKRKELLFNAMSLPNARWKALMHAASNNGGQSLKLLDSVKAVSEVLRTNISMCRAMGYAYLPYLTTIYREMLNVCKLYSEHVKMCVAKFGRNALSEPQVRFMRVAKKEALQLIELFIKKSKASHASFVAEMCLPPLLDPVLADYHASIPMARDSHVLSLMATMVNKLKEHMAPHVPVVMKSTFLVTFDMLKGNFTDFPDIRHAFFRLLHAIVTHCFSSIFQTPPEYRVAVVSCILGAMRHTERIAAEMGLDILHKFLEHVQSDNNTAQMFYKAFFMNILRDVLVILTDRHHKSGFGKQAVVLKYMFSLVENGRIQVPLGGEGSNNNSPGNNKQVVVNFVLNMISNLFPKMSKVEIQKFVSGSFDQSKSLNEFKQHLHDFLVHTKEWSGDRDNAAMFFDEQQAIKKREMAMKSRVPGLIAPYELDDDDDV